MTTVDSGKIGTRRRDRWGVLGGVAFVALSVVSNFLPGIPPAAGDAAAVTAWFTGNAGAIEAQQLVGAIGILGLLCWFGSLWPLLSRAEAGRPQLAVVAAVALGTGLALVMMGGAVAAAAALRIDSIGAGSQLFWSLNIAIFSLAGLAIAAFLGAVCIPNLRARSTPAWTSYLGLLAAIAFLAGGGGLVSDAIIFIVLAQVAFLTWCVWILAVSWFMWHTSGAQLTEGPGR